MQDYFLFIKRKEQKKGISVFIVENRNKQICDVRSV